MPRLRFRDAFPEDRGSEWIPPTSRTEAGLRVVLLPLLGIFLIALRFFPREQKAGCFEEDCQVFAAGYGALVQAGAALLFFMVLALGVVAARRRSKVTRDNVFASVWLVHTAITWRGINSACDYLRISRMVVWALSLLLAGAGLVLTFTS